MTDPNARTSLSRGLTLAMPADGGQAPARPPMDPPHGFRRMPLPPHAMTSAVTASEDLFVLAHLGIPRVGAAHWSLVIDGLIERPARFSLEELRAYPKTVIEAVHQCCGSPTEPRMPTRRVSNVRWGGVDLAALLAELGVHPQAQFLWSCGLDGGTFAGQPCDWFRKDLPLARLAAGGVLLAYELNGAPLPAENGFPLRLVVPGFYGTNSVKWLWRLSLAETRSDGIFTTDLYNDDAEATDIAAGLPPRRPVWAIAPESLIVSPAPGARLVSGRLTEIWGWAWSFAGIAAVEVSVDGGASFTRARLAERSGWTWQRFSLPWTPARPGDALLCVRAFDAGGAGQPKEGARNAIHAVPVVVEAPD